MLQKRVKIKRKYFQYSEGSNVSSAFDGKLCTCKRNLLMICNCCCCGGNCIYPLIFGQIDLSKWCNPAQLFLKEQSGQFLTHYYLLHTSLGCKIDLLKVLGTYVEELWCLNISGKLQLLQLFPCIFCHLLITFANSLDPDQDRQNVGPDLAQTV